MVDLDLDADDKDAFRRVYNNVTQRVKQLREKHEVQFPALADGPKGARRSAEQVASLQAILNGETDDEDELEIIT
jgi:hypothetical protein